MPSKLTTLGKMRGKASLLRSQRSGAILVLFAILLPLLVLIFGFTVDFAYMSRSRNEARVVSTLAARTADDTLARTGAMKFPVQSDNLSAAEKNQLSATVPQDNSRWKSLDSAVEMFLSELESTTVQEKIGLVTFAENSTRVVDGQSVSVQRASLDSPLSKNFNQMRTQMDRLDNSVWFGGTNITAGLEQARLHFASSGSDNVEKIIICLTDGEQNALGVNEPHVEARRCFEAGIKVHTVTFSDGADEISMRLAAESGGGNHTHASDEDALDLIS